MFQGMCFPFIVIEEGLNEEIKKKYSYKNFYEYRYNHGHRVQRTCYIGKIDIKASV